MPGDPITRQDLAIEVDTSLRGDRVARLGVLATSGISER